MLVDERNKLMTEEFSRKLKTHLLNLGIKQVDLCKDLGFNSTLVSLQVTGHKYLPLAKIPIFCDYLGLNTEAFMKGRIVKVRGK